MLRSLVYACPVSGLAENAASKLVVAAGGKCEVLC